MYLFPSYLTIFLLFLGTTNTMQLSKHENEIKNIGINSLISIILINFDSSLFGLHPTLVWKGLLQAAKQLE